MKTLKEPALRLHAWNVLLASAVGLAVMGSAAAMAPAPAAEPDDAFVQVEGMRCIVDRNAGTLVPRADGQPECAAPMTTQEASR